MKAIITILLISLSTVIFGQKALQEQFGNYRLHQVQSFSIDTITDEAGKQVVTNNANMIVLREGIDGAYSIAVTKAVYGNSVKTIEYLATKPEYVNFKVVK
jgi:hypothetical protein